jgi:hypothetical protein
MIVTVNIHTQFTSFHRQITLSKREPSSLACGNLIRMTVHSVIGVSKARLMAHGPCAAQIILQGEMFRMLCRNVSLICSMIIGTIKKNSLPSLTGGVLLTGQKNQKPLAAIIIPPILDTDDPARAASIAAGMHRQKKAKSNAGLEDQVGFTQMFRR